MRRLVAVAAAAVALSPAGATGASPAVSLSLDYRIPPRYGLDANRDGVIDPATTPAQVSPSSWKALVTVRWPGGGSCAGTYRWTIGGTQAAFVRQRDPVTGLPSCTFASSGFRALDRAYRVAVTATRSGVGGAGRLVVRVRDLLVVGLGDSIASGEGNPDRAVAPVRWQNRQCHRSARSFEGRVAARLEAASQKSSVTFVSLACSGASIPTGLLGPYAGIVPTGASPVPPQVDAMRALIGAREPDAVLISVGINDLGFGPVTGFCFDDGVDARTAATVDCWSKRYPTASSPTTLQAFVRSRAAALPGRFARLASALDAAGIPRTRVYLTEYPNPTRNANGSTCDPLIPYLDSRPFGYTARGMITRAEAAEAEAELLNPTNSALRTAATTYGWNLVDGIASQSTTHGLCSVHPWFVDVSESLLVQHDVLGTLHPNAAGQQAEAKRVLAALER